MTKKELIGVWAQQHGAAHEDWELDEEFIRARDSGLSIGELPALAPELKVTTEAVLSVANQFLALTPDLVKSKMAEKGLQVGAILLMLWARTRIGGLSGQSVWGMFQLRGRLLRAHKVEATAAKEANSSISHLKAAWKEYRSVGNLWGALRYMAIGRPARHMPG